MRQTAAAAARETINTRLWDVAKRLKIENQTKILINLTRAQNGWKNEFGLVLSFERKCEKIGKENIVVSARAR